MLSFLCAQPARLRYADVLGALRAPPFAMQNRVLLESNYWTGLHAQVTPEDRSSPGAPSYYPRTTLALT